MNQLIPFNENDLSLPAHLQAQFGQPQGNDELSGGVSAGYAVLSIKGKTWSLREGGVTQVIMRPGTDDDPAASLEVVIVRANPSLSKVYYPNGYVEGTDEKPPCFSNDGIAPDPGSSAPQCSTCAACPHNVWGSRITENDQKGKACADSRRIAVVPSGELDRAMLLRVPAASLKDVAAYAKMLTARNAPYQAVVTKISFDTSVAYPKLVLKAVRWLTAEEAETVRGVMDSDVVAQIIGAPGAARTVAVDEIAGTPPPMVAAPVAQKLPPAAKPAAPVATRPAPVAARPASVAARPAPVAAAPRPVAQAAPAAEPVVTSMPRFAAAPPAAKPAAPQSNMSQRIADANDDLDAALAELDDIG